MKHAWLVITVSAMFLGCESVVAPEVIQSEASLGTDAASATTPLAAAHQVDRIFLVNNFVAPLSGAEEVPPVETRAQGVAYFQLNKAGDELRYKVVVANISDVLMAHIHVAPAGENGGVVAWLYPGGPPPQLIEGRAQGLLAEGVITAGDLVGALEGSALSELIDAIRARNTYVNVHTSANQGGEIRGQIDAGNGFPR